MLIPSAEERCATAIAQRNIAWIVAKARAEAIEERDNRFWALVKSHDELRLGLHLNILSNYTPIIWMHLIRRKVGLFINKSLICVSHTQSR